MWCHRRDGTAAGWGDAGFAVNCIARNIAGDTNAGQLQKQESTLQLEGRYPDQGSHGMTVTRQVQDITFH